RQRRLATALESRQKSALGGEAAGRRGLVHLLEVAARPGVVAAALDGQRALADGGKGFFDFQRGGDGLGVTETLEAGAGEDDGVEFARLQLTHAGVDVAAQ